MSAINIWNQKDPKFLITGPPTYYPQRSSLVLLKRQAMLEIILNTFQIGYIVYRLLMSKLVNSLVCFRIYAF